MQHFCPWQIQFERLESHMILVYQYLMKGFPTMKSLWVSPGIHKSPHSHTLQVPPKMHDSILIIYKLISSFSKTYFHDLIFTGKFVKARPSAPKAHQDVQTH